VPEQHTDYIFCTVGEEYGFWGTCLLLILFFGLIYRIIELSEKQRSKFTRIYGYCIAGVFLFHAIINVAMTIGLFPTIGIPLPFISYGGSSLMAFSIMLFVFIRLDANRTVAFN
jgi:rod shape determining protein RodA